MIIQNEREQSFHIDSLREETRRRGLVIRQLILQERSLRGKYPSDLTHLASPGHLAPIVGDRRWTYQTTEDRERACLRYSANKDQYPCDTLDLDTGEWMLDR